MLLAGSISDDPSPQEILVGVLTVILVSVIVAPGVAGLAKKCKGLDSKREGGGLKIAGNIRSSQ